MIGGGMATGGEKTERPLSMEEHQQALLFQFVALYERWSEDRQVAAKQAYDLTKQLERFSEEVGRFSRIEEAVIGKLRQSLHETVVNLSEKMGGATTEALNSTLGSSVARMDGAAKKVETILAGHQEIRWLSQVKTLALNVLCSLVVSGLVVWFFMPKSTLPLTEADMNTYRIGKKFSLLWSTLPKEKQQWILSAIKDKERNEPGLIAKNK
ncbi:TPA: hypothetical protein JBB06_14785 [Legionella pneumophila subsp. pneumophila]|nr:hypothetical protein [Legionella pneumophila]AOW51842.1 hypothetical protein BE841_04930 [Legionella pneumophila subsp. pneumophila]AOW54562.1 hypothetical protein BE842_03825 [Legionella pneumophila subsp. pneumophila]AOW57139.1 hypothetical protein BE843_02140 [Legionella pneumophila subsp. pneumophila]AOW59933.1 hypothetical protein BE844_01550 [Legionella pneumophila subsp. pneumophila]AOW62636.1 hypothetical protein BE845_00505 [Legionella pneumophila subsp. pneumophila]